MTGSTSGWRRAYLKIDVEMRTGTQAVTVLTDVQELGGGVSAINAW